MGYQVLYNPNAGNGTGEKGSKIPEQFLEGDGINYVDITKINSYDVFFSGLSENEKIIIAGGDGTLNRFINDAWELLPKIDLYYYPAGSGNDFYREVGNSEEKKPVCINEYVKELPVVTVKGKEYRFINGVGYGIDGYCCEEGDRKKAQSDKPVNYASIAVEGLLFHFKPRNATITVDGKTYSFNKVWLAPTMVGKYYGGGMIPTPGQNRLSKDKTLSVLVMHGSGKIKTLIVFPSIFNGEHVSHEKITSIYRGKEISVKFDKPTPLQIDGETISDVLEYSVKFN